MQPKLNRKGTPARPPTRKRPKICPVCDKRFLSRRRFAEHLVQEKALSVFEAAHDKAAERVFGPGETILRSEITSVSVDAFGEELERELIDAGMPEKVAADLAAYARRGMLEAWGA